MNTSKLQKITWFLGLWLVSVLALGAVAYLIRWAVVG